MPDGLILNALVVDGFVIPNPPSAFTEETDQSVLQKVYKTLDGDQVIVRRFGAGLGPYVEEVTPEADLEYSFSTPTIPQRWQASWEGDTWMIREVHDLLLTLYRTQKPFWIQYDDVMSRFSSRLVFCDYERKVYATPTHPIFPYGYNPVNGATFDENVYVNGVLADPADYTIDSARGLVIFDAPLEITDVVTMKYTWRAYVRIAEFNLNGIVRAQSFYAGGLVFEEVSVTSTEDPWGRTLLYSDEYADVVNDPIQLVSVLSPYAQFSAFSSVARGGSIGAFTGPSAKVDFIAVESPEINEGEYTDYVFAQTPEIVNTTFPNGETLEKIVVTGKYWVMQDGSQRPERCIDIVDSSVFLTNDGTNISADSAVGQKFRQTDLKGSFFKYVFDAEALGLTVDDFSGVGTGLGFKISFGASVASASVWDASNWEIQSGNGDVSTPYATTDDAEVVTGVLKHQIRWVGTGDAPEFVPVRTVTTLISEGNTFCKAELTGKDSLRFSQSGEVNSGLSSQVSRECYHKVELVDGEGVVEITVDLDASSTTTSLRDVVSTAEVVTATGAKIFLDGVKLGFVFRRDKVVSYRESGWIAPTNVTELSRAVGEVGWSSETSAINHDANPAISGALKSGAVNTSLLRFTGFDLSSVPTGASIKSVLVRAVRRKKVTVEPGIGEIIEDAVVMLDGTTVVENLAGGGTTLNTSYDTQKYTWLYPTITTTELLASDFGVGLGYQIDARGYDPADVSSYFLIPNDQSVAGTYGPLTGNFYKITETFGNGTTEYPVGQVNFSKKYKYAWKMADGVEVPDYIYVRFTRRIKLEYRSVVAGAYTSVGDYTITLTDSLGLSETINVPASGTSINEVETYTTSVDVLVSKEDVSNVLSREVQVTLNSTDHGLSYIDFWVGYDTEVLDPGEVVAEVDSLRVKVLYEI